VAVISKRQVLTGSRRVDFQAPAWAKESIRIRRWIMKRPLCLLAVLSLFLIACPQQEERQVEPERDTRQERAVQPEERDRAILPDEQDRTMQPQEQDRTMQPQEQDRTMQPQEQPGN
jgi:hypothetical protein